MDTISVWASRRLELIEAYQSAIRANMAADERLRALLTAKYGKRRAGDMRYKPAETAEIADAMRAKLEASERQQNAWLAYQRPTNANVTA